VSQAPTDASDSAATKQYGQSWSDTLHLVRSGSSWSGRERNCVYLNVNQPSSKTLARFANVSAIAGLDFADDARALAVVDWDHDGDLDLWLRNRTEPRLRLMRNHAKDGITNFISIRLQGTSGHRDAIGAVVTVSHSGTQTATQFLTSGDGYLCSNERLLRFAVPNSGPIRVSVKWPDGTSQVFDDLSGETRWLITQGNPSVFSLSANPR